MELGGLILSSLTRYFLLRGDKELKDLEGLLCKHRGEEPPKQRSQCNYPKAIESS